MQSKGSGFAEPPAKKADIHKRADELINQLIESKSGQAPKILAKLFELVKEGGFTEKEKKDLIYRMLNESTKKGYKVTTSLGPSPEQSSYGGMEYHIEIPREEKKLPFGSAKREAKKKAGTPPAPSRRAPPSLAGLEGKPVSEPPNPEVAMGAPVLRKRVGGGEEGQYPEGKITRAEEGPDTGKKPGKVREAVLFSREKRDEEARAYLAKLPKAHSEKGKESLARISEDSLFYAALMEMKTRAEPPHINYDPNHLESAPPPEIKSFVFLPLDKILSRFLSRFRSNDKEENEDDGGNLTIFSWGPRREPEYGRVYILQIAGLNLSGKTDMDSPIEKKLFIGGLDDPKLSPHARAELANYLGLFRVAEAVPLLADILHNPEKNHPVLVNAARLALADINNEESEAELRKNPNDYALVLAYRYSRHPSDEKADELVRLVSKGLPFEVELDLVAALAMEDNKTGLGLLEKRLKDLSLSPGKRRDVAMLAAAISGNKNVGKMIISALDSNPAEKPLFAAALGLNASEEAVAALSKLLNDRDPKVGVEAANSLFRLSTLKGQKEDLLAMKAGEALIESARKGNEFAAVALAQTGHLERGSIRALEKALRSENAHLREMAVAGVAEVAFGGGIAPAAGANMLAGLENDPDKNVAEKAREALGKLSELMVRLLKERGA